jgi:hypothetical protein
VAEKAVLNAVGAAHVFGAADCVAEMFRTFDARILVRVPLTFLDGNDGAVTVGNGTSCMQLWWES